MGGRVWRLRCGLLAVDDSGVESDESCVVGDGAGVDEGVGGADAVGSVGGDEAGAGGDDVGGSEECVVGDT